MHAFLRRVAPFWKPHPGQRAFLLARAKTRVLACGRRWGKTEACAAEIVHALGKATASRHILVAPTLEQARILFDRVVAFLDRMYAANLQLWEAQPKIRLSPHPRIELAGHEVVARSGHRARSLRGHEASHVIVDEAAFVDKGLIEDTLWPMLATRDGEMTLISTPNGRNAFWRFFQLGVRGQHGVWSRRAPTSENPRVPPAFLNAQRELQSERTYAIEYEAEFLDLEGALFKEHAIAACLGADWEASNGPWFVGVDFARDSDFTVVAVVSGNQYRATLVQMERFNLIGWDQQIAKIRSIVEQYPNAHVLADATAIGGDMLTQALCEALRRHRVEAFVFDQKSKARLCDRLVALAEHRRLKIPPDPVLLREMQAFRWRNGKLTGDPEHDDTVIALALATYNLPHGGGSQILMGQRR